MYLVVVELFNYLKGDQWRPQKKVRDIHGGWMKVQNGIFSVVRVIFIETQFWLLQLVQNEALFLSKKCAASLLATKITIL